MGMKLCMFDMFFTSLRFTRLAADQSGGGYISSMTSSTEYTECQASCPVVRIGSHAPPCNPQVSVAYKGDTLAWGGGRRGPWGDPILTKGQTL
jgi:hypothetical protein